MGLDNFKSDDSDSSDSDNDSNSSTSQSSSSHSKNVGVTNPITELDMSFYGTGKADTEKVSMKRVGALSDYSMGDLIDTINGSIEFESDNIKLYTPIFTHFSRDKLYGEGERYQLVYTEDEPSPSWNGKVVVCIAVNQTTLGQMNKEIAMFETGYHLKDDVMQEMKSKLGKSIDGETDIYVNFFADAFFIRDLAQANNEYREGDIINRDDVVSKVLRSKRLRYEMKEDE